MIVSSDLIFQEKIHTWSKLLATAEKSAAAAATV